MLKRFNPITTTPPPGDFWYNPFLPPQWPLLRRLTSSVAELWKREKQDQDPAPEFAVEELPPPRNPFLRRRRKALRTRGGVEGGLYVKEEDAEAEEPRKEIRPDLLRALQRHKERRAKKESLATRIQDLVGTTADVHKFLSQN